MTSSPLVKQRKLERQRKAAENHRPEYEQEPLVLSARTALEQEQMTLQHVLVLRNALFRTYQQTWPKTRHAKRRLTYASFLQTYRQVLKEAGEIHLKTDNEPLFEFSLNQFAAERFQMRNITFDLHQSKLAEENVMTEYEERFSSRGQRIYRVEASCQIK